METGSKDFIVSFLEICALMKTVFLFSVPLSGKTQNCQCVALSVSQISENITDKNKVLDQHTKKVFLENL